MIRYFILFLIFAVFPVFGQENYQLETIDHNQLIKYVQLYHQSNEKLIQKIKSKYPRKIAKKLIKNIEAYGEGFEKSILNGDFTFDKRFLNFANRILDNLKAKNNTIPKNVNVLISKDPSLNAYCLPDGTFVLNIGLFYFLENTDQIAGVMSHELSHYLLNHLIKQQVQQIQESSSKDRKKQIRQIKRSRFNRTKRAFNLYKNLLYANRKNSRKKEIEADSLGFLLVEKTDYNPAELIKSLKLVKMYDTIRPKNLKKDIYAKIFDLPNQKFNPKWLQMEDYSGYHYDLYKVNFNIDSIATHPDEKIRINKLKTLLDAHHYEMRASQPDKVFIELHKIAEYNFVPNLMHFDRIGQAIYLSLLQLQEGKDETYYKKLLGENFKKILEARKKYQLNRYLDRPNPKKQSKSYLQFLNFMWNLSLQEIENIAEHYAK